MRKGIDGLATKSKNRNIEISKYNLPDGKAHYLMMTRILANLSTQKNKANRQFLILLYEKLHQKNEMIPCMMVLK